MTNRMICLVGIAVAMGAGYALAQGPPPPPPAAPPPPPAAERSVRIHRQPVSYLGIGVAEIDADRAKALNLKEVRGVEVKNVDEESAAAKAGLKVGDVVLEYNGERIEGTEQFMRVVRETPPGREVHLVVSRNGARTRLTATMGSRPDRFVMRGQNFNIHIPEIHIPDIQIPEIPSMPMMDLPASPRAWRSSALGLESEALSPQLAQFFGVKEGVLVRSVEENSAAAKAGIKAGDVIVRVGETAVTSPREISGALRSMRGSKSIPVVVVRDKREVTVTVSVEDEPRMRGIRPVKLSSVQC